MMRAMRWACAIGVLATVVGGASRAGAQATRTWVSGVGDDANPCSRTAPCRTFAGAIPKTAAGGEINALDPGGFGAVTITKSIIIDGGNMLAGVLVSGTNGIVVSAAPTDRVVLRGLDINGIGTGVNGIRFLAGASLHVERCTIANFTTLGIDVTTGGKVFVKDTILRGNAGGGIQIAPSSGTAQATIEGTHADDNLFGVHVKGNALATVHDSSASGNAGAGFWAETAPAELNVDGSVAANNQTGIRATDSALVRLTAVTVSGNSADGLLAETSGQIVPFTSNLIAGNPTPAGAPVCEIDAGTTTVPCPGESAVCQAPVVKGKVGPCRHCKTKQGVTTCSACAVQLQ